MMWQQIKLITSYLDLAEFWKIFSNKAQNDDVHEARSRLECQSEISLTFKTFLSTISLLEITFYDFIYFENF